VTGFNYGHIATKPLLICQSYSQSQATALRTFFRAPQATSEEKRGHPNRSFHYHHLSGMQNQDYKGTFLDHVLLFSVLEAFAKFLGENCLHFLSKHLVFSTGL